MAGDPQNQQYVNPPFGMSKAIASTGAAGSPTVQDSPPGMGGGSVIASPVISAPFGSSQLPANLDRLPVTQGDTCSLSSDSPVPSSGDPLTGVSLADITETGAGQGHTHYGTRPS